MNLPPRQKEALDAIVCFMAWHGFPPTIAELAATMKISVNGAAKHLSALNRRGVISRQPGTARGLRVLHPTG